MHKMDGYTQGAVKTLARGGVLNQMIMIAIYTETQKQARYTETQKQAKQNSTVLVMAHAWLH